MLWKYYVTKFSRLFKKKCLSCSKKIAQELALPFTRFVTLEKSQFIKGLSVLTYLAKVIVRMEESKYMPR